MQHVHGSCHCGKITYEADVDLAQPVIECNCSHCQIKGLLLSFIPLSSFTLISGKENMTEYRFNTHTIAHIFCAICGVQPLGKGADDKGNETVAINVRTVSDIDLNSLIKMPYDGKNR